MFHPQVIKHNFFDKEEVEDIKNKVFNLKQHWSYLMKPLLNPESLDVQMLPAGLYSMPYDQYAATLSSTRLLMEENFSLYYEKIKQSISEYLNRPVEYSAKMHYPGFHIFILDKDSDRACYHGYNFHRDNFQTPDLSMDQVYSFIIPISLPKTGGSLIYKISNDALSRNYNSDQDVVFPYSVGSLITWPGHIWHSIDPFCLNYPESRITMQCHAGLNRSRCIIFW